MTKTLCLSCDRDFDSNVDVPQCGKCFGRDTISYLQLNKIAVEAARHINTTSTGALPFLEVMSFVLRSTGLRLKPVSTLKLCVKIHEIIQANMRKNMSDSLSVSTDRDRAL